MKIFWDKGFRRLTCIISPVAGISAFYYAGDNWSTASVIEIISFSLFIFAAVWLAYFSIRFIIIGFVKG